jgi:predicted CXXCH cytochrome family protein
MKQVRFYFLTVLVLFFVQAGFAQTIVGSKHDFSGQAWNTSVGQQICIVCHTPHNASTTVTDAPLWNHSTTATTFALYTSSTLNATMSQPDASSKLCLSCHDGTVALENFGATTSGTHFISGTYNIGSGLNNDHPISITYDATLASADGGLKNPATALSGLGGTINANMLFGGKMQCASCHDVHNTAGQAKLLLKSNNASALCLTCHSK